MSGAATQVARFIFALIVFAMALAVLKLVLVAIVLAGLIFRQKETFGLLLLLGLWALFKAYPGPTLILGGVIAVAALVRWSKSSRSSQPPTVDGMTASPALPAPDPPPD